MALRIRLVAVAAGLRVAAMTDPYFDPEQEAWVNSVLVAIEQDREQALALLRTMWRSMQMFAENNISKTELHRKELSKLYQEIEELRKKNQELLSVAFKKQWLDRLLLLAGEIADDECLTASEAAEKYGEY